MKLLLALSLMAFTTVSMACTNFSGSYRDSSDGQTYTLTQSGREAVTISSQTGTDTIITDGQYRVSADTAEVRGMTAASFIGNNLTINNTVEFKIPFPAEMPTDSIPTRMTIVITLDSAGNLVAELVAYNSNNQVIEQSTQTHQKI